MKPAAREGGILLASRGAEAVVLVTAAVGVTLATGPIIAMSGGLRAWVVVVLVASIGLATLGTDGSARVALLVLPLVGLIRRVTAGPTGYVESDPLVPLAVLLLLPAALLPLRRDGRRSTTWLLALAAWLAVSAAWSLRSGQGIAAGYAMLTATAP